MDKSNSKVLTLSFAVFSVIVAVTFQLLIKALSGAFGVVARAADSDLVRHILPVVIGFVVFAILQFNPKILAWGDSVVAEIRKVVFPGRKDVTLSTIVVIVMVMISSLIITTFDFMSGVALSSFLK